MDLKTLLDIISVVSALYVIYYLAWWGPWEIRWWVDFFRKHFGGGSDDGKGSTRSVRDLYPD